jgi:hypothetical protein
VNPKPFFGGSAVQQKRTDGSAPAPLAAVKIVLPSILTLSPLNLILAAAQAQASGRPVARAAGGGRPSRRRRAAVCPAQASGHPSRRTASRRPSKRTASVRPGFRPGERQNFSTHNTFQEPVLFYALFRCPTRSGENAMFSFDGDWAAEEKQRCEFAAGFIGIRQVAAWLARIDLSPFCPSGWCRRFC